MSDLLAATDHAHGLPLNEPKPKRVTRSYQSELATLQAAVNVALSLLASVKVEKGSVDVLNAAIGVLRGSKP